MTPEDRATLEWAYRVGLGFSAEDEVVVLRDLSIIIPSERMTLDPSSSPHDALLVALAQAMKLHLTGVNFGKLRLDLIAAGMGKEAANSVHDHLVDISVEEWDRLRERINWYGDDNGDPIAASTKASGDT
ncbi:hypothetical protein PEL8287_03697 [Roseovarius litorisediminis]|uniref:Uncharacterized protein n=1 Tax=Roseovarius litorisediminis TaxID=1312363 RepID=A0A1Y5TL17_9RHOB|nr:hypothetical protein [Roseovarius litorisediminis]SLN66668.1 hypothetical protein PEL8287_03697 [Roseovarius litorisediminis]